MSDHETITFRCDEELYNRLEEFAMKHGIDRTSAIKFALHYHLNAIQQELQQSTPAPEQAKGDEQGEA